MAISNESKVGLLVLAALAGLGYLSVRSGSYGASTGGVISSTPMRDLNSAFTDVDGISVGSPVKMAGVNVGEVTSVTLKPSGIAVLGFKIRKDVPLSSDVAATVTTSGIIGEKFVSLISTGATSNTALLAADVKEIPSSGAANPANIAGDFAKVADDLQEMTTTLRRVFGNAENADKIQTIIDGLASFSSNLGGEGGNVFSKFEKVADNMTIITDRLKNGEGMLGQMLMGDSKAGAGGPMGGLGDLNAAMKDLREVMAKINNGQGTLGKLVNDPQTAEKLDNALDTFSQVSERMEQFRTEVDFNGYSLTNENSIGKGGATLTLAPRPTRFYVLGMTGDGFASRSSDMDARGTNYFGKDFGNKAKFTAQFGHVFQNVVGSQDVALRVGLKDSTAGIGVDTKVPVPYGSGLYADLSADVYDFGGDHTPGSDDPHIDLKAKLPILGNTVYGLVGYDNLLNSEYGSPIIGAGMRFQDDDLKYILGQAL